MTRRTTRPRGRVPVLLLLCAVLSVVGLSAAGPGARTDAAAATRPVGWLHTSGSTLLDDRDRPHVIRAVSWFGMETPLCAPHGLWQISLDDGLARIASFGFNTVRLPFSNACLAAGTVEGVDARTNPDLQGLAPLELMDVVVERASAHGLSVLLDRHRPGSDAQSELWATADYPEARWVEDWTMLAERYADEPAVVGVDLHNEPHGPACWGCGDPARDWAAAATRAGNAVLAANPRLLVVVEGVERQADGQSTWWGGSLADVADHPLILDVPGRVVYSPHDYPASIYPQPYFSDPGYPANLEPLWRARWGYLQEQGVAPVLLGEFGTTLRTPSDRHWLDALVGYLDRTGASFAYWSFNPDSGDTGGLVADDWVTPQADKLAALAPLLRPGRPVSPVPTPSATPTAPRTSSPAPTPSAPTAPAPASPTPAPSDPAATPGSGTALTARWTLRESWGAGYVADVQVAAAGAARSGWTLRVEDPSATAVTNAWGMTCAVDDGVITCTGQDWGAAVPAGGAVRVGLQVQSSGPAPAAPRLTLS
ncbi:cellulase family glycosylhydrolase [Microlunatus capsulatus]|uniref:Endoglucanase n=1 Tax=Microlunatus capsulatus TaxID=99117 RepID=A0ABS4ZCZ1_9ACTN|nr:cellulase family glycosylhydrolase [Microlunatus capsulatus]MBP2418928.1 endoglucanase [Microlunatus capsulatus]